MSESKSKDDWTNLLATEALVLRSGQSWADIVDDDDGDIDGGDESNRTHKGSTITTETIESNEKPVDYLEDIDITVPLPQIPSKQTSNDTRFDWDSQYNHNQEPPHPSAESDNWRVRDSKGMESDNWRVRDPQGDGLRKPTSFTNFNNRDRFEKQEDRSDYRHPENRRVDPEDATALAKWNTFHLVVAQEELEKEKEKERLKKRFLEGEQQKIDKEDGDEGTLSSELVKGDTNQQICINSNESQEKKIDQVQNTDKYKLDPMPTENLFTSAEIKDSEKSLNSEDKKLKQGVTEEDENGSSDKKKEVISIEKDQIENSTPSYDEEASVPVKEEEKKKVKMDTPKEEVQVEKTNSEADHEKLPVSIKEDEEEAKLLSNHEKIDENDDEKSIPVAETEKTVEQEDSKENFLVTSEQQEEVLELQAVESEQFESSTKTNIPQKESESQQDQYSKEKSQSNVLLESEDVEEKEKVKVEEKEKEDVKMESKVDESKTTTDQIDSSKISPEEQTDKAKELQQEESINNNVKEETSLEEIKEESATSEKQDTQETVLLNGPEESEISENVKEEKEETGEKEKEKENPCAKDKDMNSPQPEQTDTQNTQFIDNQNKTNDTLNENENSPSVTDQAKKFLDPNQTNGADSSWSKEPIKELSQTEPTGWGGKPVTGEVSLSAEPKKEETGWSNGAGWTQESKKEAQTTEGWGQGLPKEGSQWNEPKSRGNQSELNKGQPRVDDDASWNQEKQQDKTSRAQDQNSSNTMSTSTHSNSWGTINKVKSPKVVAKKPPLGSWRSQIESAPENDNAGSWKQFASNEAAISTVKKTRIESPKPKKAFIPKNMQSSPKLDKSWNNETTSWSNPTDSWSKASDITTQTTSSTPTQSDAHQADPSWSKISKSPNLTKANPSWSSIQESHSKSSTLTNENPSWSQTQNNWSNSQAWSATTQAQSQLKPHEAAAQPTTQQQQQQQQQQQRSNREPPVFSISLSPFDGIQLEPQKEVVKEEKKTAPNAPIEINLSWNGDDIVMHPPTENINIMHAPLTVALDDELQELQITPNIEHATPPVQQLHSSTTTTTTTTTTSESTDFWSQQTQNNEWNLAYHNAHPEPSSSTESNGHRNRPRIQMDGSQWKLMNKFLKNK